MLQDGVAVKKPTGTTTVIPTDVCDGKESPANAGLSFCSAMAAIGREAPVARITL